MFVPKASSVITMSATLRRLVVSVFSASVGVVFSNATFGGSLVSYPKSASVTFALPRRSTSRGSLPPVNAKPVSGEEFSSTSTQ